MQQKTELISLGYKPQGCRRVRVTGLRPNIDDYPSADREWIIKSKKILYPTRYYAQPLTDAGKKVFPSARQYFYHGDKIRQTALFNLLGLPHPKTRVYYGRWARRALDEFRFPFVAKIPCRIGQGRGVFLIENEKDYTAYLGLTRTAYVQERLEIERDLRVVAIAGRLLTAYWRLAPEGDFRTNVRQGGRIDFSGVPEEGVEFGLEAARRCGFDDVGLDLCLHQGGWFILEANMHYGREGIKAAGLSWTAFFDRLIEDGLV